MHLNPLTIVALIGALCIVVSWIGIVFFNAYINHRNSRGEPSTWPTAIGGLLLIAALAIGVGMVAYTGLAGSWLWARGHSAFMARSGLSTMGISFLAYSSLSWIGSRFYESDEGEIQMIFAGLASVGEFVFVLARFWAIVGGGFLVWQLF